MEGIMLGKHQALIKQSRDLEALQARVAMQYHQLLTAYADMQSK